MHYSDFSCFRVQGAGVCVSTNRWVSQSLREFLFHIASSRSDGIQKRSSTIFIPHKQMISPPGYPPF